MGPDTLREYAAGMVAWPDHRLAMQRPVMLIFSWRTRLYTAVLEQDLFGQWTVTRSWGSRRNGQGGGRITVVSDFDSGLAVLHTIARRREKMGYQIIKATEGIGVHQPVNKKPLS